MTRRHILAAPIAALLGKALPPRMVLGFDGRLHTPGTVWREAKQTGETRTWRDLEQLNRMRDAREGRV